MTRIGFYVHGGSHEISDAIRNEMQRTGNGEVDIPYKCLCQSGNDRLPETVFCHPERSDASDCWETVKKVIEGNPKTRFYILEDGEGERRQGIGEHPNAEYILTENRERIFRMILGYKSDLAA